MSAGTIAAQKQDRTQASSVRLINWEALVALAREYAKGQTLPRISGTYADITDNEGRPVPAPEPIVVKDMADELEEMLIPLLQNQFRKAIYKMAEVYSPEMSVDGNGRPLIEDRFRVAPPFNGTLRVVGLPSS